MVRDGGALENLGRATTLVLDKTGTVTRGRPRGTDVLVAPGWTPSEVLRLAASADQVSRHVLARAIVEEAATEGAAAEHARRCCRGGGQARHRDG